MKKILVACFSASGVTKKVAERLVEAVNGDLFEIVPEEPYTKADLNWMDRESRSTLEMNDRNSRPAISSKVEDMETYDTVFVGFPIWWYREPSIIDTFMEMYDFKGKTVIPFATSGTSGLGDTAKNLQELVPEAKVLEGARLKAGIKEDKLKEWAAEYL
ncbi:MAG: NAD(P)H-dependent oxidoreductase [Erysipelotrichaceae bacterium]|nr:NAD(P)H-dependent oxidoreductase [Erysipelotrichaceae bacterium]